MKKILAKVGYMVFGSLLTLIDYYLRNPDHNDKAKVGTTTKGPFYTISLILFFTCLFSGCGSKGITPTQSGSEQTGTNSSLQNSRIWKAINAPTPWISFKEEKEKDGYISLSQEESKAWIKDWLDAHNINEITIEFEFPQTLSIDGIVITADAENNPRVFIPENVPPTSTPYPQWSPKQQQWNDFVARQHKQGYIPMSVQESRNWIDNPPNGLIRDGALIAVTIRSIGETFWIGEFFITVDHKDNPRVFKKMY